MNAFKRYIWKHGVMLDSDYEYLPYDVKGKFMEPGHIYLETVLVDSEAATFTEVLNVMDVTYQVDRNGNIEMI